MDKRLCQESNISFHTVIDNIFNNYTITSANSTTTIRFQKLNEAIMGTTSGWFHLILSFFCLYLSDENIEKNNHPSLYQLHERQNTGRCSNIKKKNHDEDKEVLSKDLLQLFKWLKM